MFRRSGEGSQWVRRRGRVALLGPLGRYSTNLRSEAAAYSQLLAPETRLFRCCQKITLPSLWSLASVWEVVGEAPVALCAVLMCGGKHCPSHQTRYLEFCLSLTRPRSTRLLFRLYVAWIREIYRPRGILSWCIVGSYQNNSYLFQTLLIDTNTFSAVYWSPFLNPFVLASLLKRIVKVGVSAGKSSCSLVLPML